MSQAVAQVEGHANRHIIITVLNGHLDTDDDADEGSNGERHQEAQHLRHAGPSLRAAAQKMISIACLRQLQESTWRPTSIRKGAESPWSRRRAILQSLQAGHKSSPAHLHKAGADGHALNPLVRSHRNKCCHHIAVGALRSSARSSESV